MERLVEPELMDEPEQAQAYAAADFAQAHASYVGLFQELFGPRPAPARALDLGCGPADITIRFCQAFPELHFDAVDGSAAMLACARPAIERANLSGRIRLIRGVLPNLALPGAYDVILSNNLLHHLHDPGVLWRSVREQSKPGTIVFVTDLVRPETEGEARVLVETYAAGEPEILRRDFYNSLRAAFTVSEVRQQLQAWNLQSLRIEKTSDRHLCAYGRVELNV